MICVIQVPSFIISYDENKSDCEIDQTYNSFCKYALGISKYSSTLTLGELSKFPLPQGQFPCLSLLTENGARDRKCIIK